MTQLTRSGKTSPTVYALARELTNRLRQKSYRDEVRVLHAFVRDKIRYVRDVRGIESLQTPDKTLEFHSGDCDDKAVLVASLLESIGHKTRFVAVGFAPGRFQHVYAETKVGQNWVPLETTEPVGVGWYPPNQRARMILHTRRE